MGTANLTETAIWATSEGKPEDLFFNTRWCDGIVGCSGRQDTIRGVVHGTEEAIRAEECAHLLHIEATRPHISGDEYPSGAIPVCSQPVQHHTFIVIETITVFELYRSMYWSAYCGFLTGYSFDAIKTFDILGGIESDVRGGV